MKQKMDTADLNKLAYDIIDIAKLCTSYVVKVYVQYFL